jgi:hypothetical protein
LLTPPSADMNTTLRREVCMSRVTRWMKDIGVTPPRLQTHTAPPLA